MTHLPEAWHISLGQNGHICQENESLSKLLKNSKGQGVHSIDTTIERFSVSFKRDSEKPNILGFLLQQLKGLVKNRSPCKS